MLWNRALEWDLADLSALQKLRVLYCPQNHELTGSLESLHALSRTLTTCNLHGCQQVTGNLKDMATMPVLEELDVGDTEVTGDIRKIGANDFRSLKSLELSAHIYGGSGKMKRVSDAPGIMSARYKLMKRIPGAFKTTQRLRLSEISPDRYVYQGRYGRVCYVWSTDWVEVDERCQRGRL
jgi:hypothetical protein